MEIEIYEKQTNAEFFEYLPNGTIFEFNGSIMMKIYNCAINEECGLVMDPDDDHYMETYEIKSSAPIYNIYVDSKLTIQ